MSTSGLVDHSLREAAIEGALEFLQLRAPQIAVDQSSGPNALFLHAAALVVPEDLDEQPRKWWKLDQIRALRGLSPWLDLNTAAVQTNSDHLLVKWSESARIVEAQTQGQVRFRAPRPSQLNLLAQIACLPSPGAGLRAISQLSSHLNLYESDPIIGLDECGVPFGYLETLVASSFARGGVQGLPMDLIDPFGDRALTQALSAIGRRLEVCRNNTSSTTCDPVPVAPVTSTTGGFPSSPFLESVLLTLAEASVLRVWHDTELIGELSDVYKTMYPEAASSFLQRRFEANLDGGFYGDMHTGCLDLLASEGFSTQGLLHSACRAVDLGHARTALRFGADPQLIDSVAGTTPMQVLQDRQRDGEPEYETKQAEAVLSLLFSAAAMRAARQAVSEMSSNSMTMGAAP